MNTHKQIQQIAATDELLDQAIALTPIRKPKDLNHLQRRQQQRAISNDMIRVAIATSSSAEANNSGSGSGSSKIAAI